MYLLVIILLIESNCTVNITLNRNVYNIKKLLKYYQLRCRRFRCRSRRKCLYNELWTNTGSHSTVVYMWVSKNRILHFGLPALMQYNFYNPSKISVVTIAKVRIGFNSSSSSSSTWHILSKELSILFCRLNLSDVTRRPTRPIFLSLLANRPC